jgi:hypothetical protein
MKLDGMLDTLPAFKLLEALDADIPDAGDWEPEALFAELEDEGVPTSQRLQDKLSAALVVRDRDDFFTSPLVFENVATAFGNLHVVSDILQEPSVRHMVWAIAEVTRIRAEGERKLDHPTEEVAKFAAVVLHRAGWVLAPKVLSFAQDHLDDMNHNSALAKAVRLRWSELENADLAGVELSEDPVGVQVSRLVDVTLYTRARLKD